MNYVVRGKVVEEHTGSGLAGLRVEAWDYDPGRDDYLGSAVTQHDGTFEIVFNEYLFRELFTDYNPDLYFKVYSGAALLVSTQDSVIWNVKKTVTAVTIKVPYVPEQPPCVIRDIYLKIERIEGYSTVRPQEKVAPPIQYGRDCMRFEGHENGLIPEAEIEARSLTAVVYREYLDSGYLIPKTDKIILADINEPAYNHRVPGTVIYTRPCERLKIHVWNDDDVPHSLHVHGLRYGIDSDGSWPFGTENHHGNRSDAICPGETWTYTFDVLDDMVGPWPFHDHTEHHSSKIERGLIGGIIVLPPHERPPRCHPRPHDLECLYTDVASLEGVKFKLCKDPTHTHSGGGHEHDDSHEHEHSHEREHADAGGHSHGEGEGHRHDEGEGHHKHGPGAIEPLERPFALPARLHAKRLSPESLRLIQGRVAFLEELAVKENLLLIRCHNPTEHVPVFFHVLSSEESKPVFASPDLEEFVGVFEHTFDAAGDNEYFCTHHPVMTGVVRVVAGGPANVTVNIVDGPPMTFSPADVTVGVGGTVRWENHSMHHHTVTSKAGASLATHCINGRGFVGNSPTIVGRSGQRIRWYVFNLDTGLNWHNFHPHAMRWKFAGETIDIRSMGPAESFIVDAEIPPVLLLDEHVAHIQDPDNRPKDAKLYNLKGDFVFHCHVHHHMMNGMVGLVRAQQRVWLTDEMAEHLQHTIGLALDDGTNSCPDVDPHPCHVHGTGRWEEVAGDPEVTFMHSVLLPNTDRVLFWGYTRADQSRVWDYSTPAGSYMMPANQAASLPGMNENTSDMWSAAHAILDTPEGLALIHGGFSPTNAFVFDPTTLLWAQVGSTAENKFYATTLVIGDGRAISLYGPGVKSFEVYTHGVGWAPPAALPASMFQHEFYPWTYLLPDGRLFIAGPHEPPQRFDWTAPAGVESFPTNCGDRSTTGGEKGTSVLQILRPPDYKPVAVIMAGDRPETEDTAEQIDLSAPAPAWVELPSMSVERNQQCTATLLPDGRILIAGGVSGGADGGPCEIFDPRNPGAGWQVGPNMTYTRGYHSSFILLRDGSVLAGGDPPGPGGPTPHERFFPDYFDMPRPTITAAPATINYGAPFSVSTPTPADISEVVLLRPGAVTHGFNMSQRGIECVITGTGAGDITVAAPPTTNHQPPGWHLLFILDSNRVPSVGRWIRLTP
jgi:plastocyanin